uniref:CCHC-type domain-containing protein n=1 Tax=Nelumbo nucifera TaxID=4432 RepID=A0A822ZWC0_NELNU|nr:TPA_asm: hypothetical protein HUJ06_019124 [Nelumbo nucifera]
MDRQIAELGEELAQHATQLGSVYELNIEPETLDVVARTLRGRIFPRIQVNEDNIKTFVWNAWNPTTGVEVDHDDSGGWVFIFDKEEDMQRVLNGGPWFIHLSWMLIAKWREGLVWEKIKLWHQNLWVQLINAPRSHIFEKNCKLLVSPVGRVLDSPYSVSPGKPSRGRAIRMRVELDLRKPLFCDFFLKNTEKPTWTRFAYDGLTKLCFYCGLVGHQWKKCKQLPPGVPHEEVIKEMENRSLEAPGECM